MSNPSDDLPVKLWSMRLPIRWGDMDAHHHVNNAETMRYFEEARVAWSLHHQLRNIPDCGMIVARATVNYKKPLEYPGSVLSEMFVARIGNSSFDLHQKLIVEGSGVLATTGDFVIVWFDYAAGKAAPLPDRFRAILQGNA